MEGSQMGAFQVERVALEGHTIVLAFEVKRQSFALSVRSERFIRKGTMRYAIHDLNSAWHALVPRRSWTDSEYACKGGW
jgi:hypothetical protein